MIERLEGKYRFLSNFWPAVVVYDEVAYSSVEHAYQAAKTTIREERLAIGRCLTAREAKVMGRKVAIRPGWDHMKLVIMNYLVREKFNMINHPELVAKLIGTHPMPIVEGNLWGDKYWGVCLKTYEGENHLGKILVKVREELIAKQQPNKLNTPS